MIGNHPSNRGGMTSVINQIREHDWEKEGIKLSFIPTFIPGNSMKKILFFLVALTKILWIFIFSKPDIVYMHMSYKGSFTRKYIVHKLCIVFSVKDVVHLHGSEFEKWYKTVNKKKKKRIRNLLSNCNKVIVLGDKWKDIISKIEHQTNLTVLNNGIIIPEQKVKWNEDTLNILFLGVLIPRKGVADLIQAVSNLKRKKQDISIKVIIAGAGEEEDALKKQVQINHIEDIVEFKGWVSGEKKIKLLVTSQLFISPSYNEGLPVSILEAASYGLPIISTNVGDVTSVVRDGVNGYLIKPGDIDAIAKSVFLMSEQKRWERFSHNSREIIKKNFNIDLFYSRLLNIIKDVAAR